MLRETILEYFRNVPDETIDGEILGLISPHAGYAYSGQVAAHGYKAVMGQSIELVIILAPMHRGFGESYVITSANAYETPLGLIPVDLNAVETISKMIDVKFVKEDSEHSLEIQLPFLQVSLNQFKLLPILVGYGDVFEGEELIKPLLSIMENKNSIIIASSDLHHIPDYRQVKKEDQKVVDTLKTLNLKKIRSVLNDNDCSVCGKVPICLTMEVANKKGLNQLKVLSFKNSGDVTGEKGTGQYTVGYLSAALIKKN